MGFLNRLFDMISVNQTYLQRYGTIIWLSLISAAMFMLIFKKFSDQKAIKLEKGRILGYLLQIRLYKDRLPLILSSIFNILKHNLFYIRHTVVPLIIIIIPLLIITVQVNQRCGYLPLQTDNEFIVSASVADAGVLDSIRCRPSPGIEVVTPVLRIPDQKKAFWRARIRNNAGPAEMIGLHASGQELGNKKIAVDLPMNRFSPKTIRANSIDALFYNAEGFLPAGSVLKQIRIQYRRAGYSFFGLTTDSLVLYFILTLVFALMIKPFFKVTI